MWCISVLSLLLLDLLLLAFLCFFTCELLLLFFLFLLLLNFFSFLLGLFKGNGLKTDDSLFYLHWREWFESVKWVFLRYCFNSSQKLKDIPSVDLSIGFSSDKAVDSFTFDNFHRFDPAVMGFEFDAMFIVTVFPSPHFSSFRFIKNRVLAMSTKSKKTAPHCIFSLRSKRNSSLFYWVLTCLRVRSPSRNRY